MANDRRLSLALLGSPVIDVAGAPLHVDTRKAIALLAYLAVEGGPTRRDTVAALLWPDVAPDRARATLRRTLSALRSALGDRWLVSDRDTMALADGEVVVDVHELRALLATCGAHGHLVTETCRRCREPLERAVSLARGPFLAGFGLRDSVPFDDWQQRVDDDVRRDMAIAFDRLADVVSAAGEHAEAIGLAERRLALDPLHEPAHRRLIELYARAGDRAAALEQYRDCVRTLDRELGVRPLEETTALYHAVLEGNALPQHPSPPPILVTDTQPYPFVGREQALAALHAALDDVHADGRLVVVEGEAGIGKSRLLEELANSVGSDRSVTVRCFPEESDLPYGLAIQLVRATLARVEEDDTVEDHWWRAEVARLAPELGPPASPSVDSVAGEARFYEAVCELLTRPSRRTAPWVIAIDDLHWADEPSVSLLAYLLRRLRERPLLVVVTWRPDEITPTHPIRQLLAGGRRGRLAQPVPLARLTVDDVRELVTSSGHDAGLAARLHRESGGLPFFVVEYLDALDRGDEDETAAWPMPGGVRDLLHARLDGLGELAGQVVAAAAVVGGSIPVEVVRDASGRGDDETVSALEQLVEAGLLVESGEQSYDFRHEQARELVLMELSLARRRLLHRRVAAALSGRGRLDAAVIAGHLALAGDDVEAAAAYVVAGDAARSLYANATALRHYQSALAHGHPDVATLQLAIGDLETLEGDYGAALASYQRAASESNGEALAVIERRIGLLHHRRGAWDLAESAFASSAAAVPDDALVLRSQLEADRSLTAHRRGDAVQATSRAEQALVLAESADDPHALAQAHNIVGILAAAAGEESAAREHLEQSVSLSRDAGDRAAEAAALNNLAQAVGGVGDLEAAITLTGEALVLCVGLGDRHREAALRNNLADLLRAAGRTDDSMTELKQAVAIFAEVGEEGKLEPEIWKLVEW